MASAALGSELTCSICLELFHDPVTLPCMHSYCRKCLEPIFLSGCGKQVQCPECRKLMTLDKTGLQKLPRNFTLANIVAKYRSVDKNPQIPCDLCDEKLQQNAAKSCPECNLSYCINCLIHHPQRGVLAKHSLIEPQEFVSRKKKLVCLKCAGLPGKDSKLEACKGDHGSDVMDVETGKIKLMSKMQGDYVILDERRRKYLQEMYKTTETLNDIMKNADLKRTDIKQAYDYEKEDILSDLDEDFKTIQDDYDSGIKEVTDKGQGHLLHLKEASDHLSDILPDIKDMLGKTEKDLDFKELQGLYSRVQKKVEERELPNCALVLPYFDINEKVKEISSKQNKASDTIVSKVVRKVTILSCTRNPRKKGEGASVTVKWNLPGTRTTQTKSEIKCVELSDIVPGPSHVIIVRNLGFPSHLSSYTINQLQPNVTYSITVTFQGRPEYESESTIVNTLPGVQCEPFSLSSIKKSKHTRLDWTHKCLTQDPSPGWCNCNQLQKAYGLCTGTLLLGDSCVYWEVEVSYHLRGVPNNHFVMCVGVCAEEKLDAVPDLVQNPYLYGILEGKNIKGQPALWTMVEGKCDLSPYLMKCERQYDRRYGIFFRAMQPDVVIVDALKNSVLQKTKQLQTIRGERCKYCPIFFVSPIGDGDPSINIVTGTDITSIPTCLTEYL